MIWVMAMNELISLFAVLIVVLLFGMTVMRMGLEMLSKRHMKNLLLKMTDSPWKSFMCGIILTAAIQSSSAVMVITVGLLAAGVIQFRNTIGIILGANIGTTVTAEMFTLDISHSIIPLLGIGAILLLFRKQLIFSCGCILFGLGTIFTAINGLGDLAKPLAGAKWIHHMLLIANNSDTAGTLIGAIFTAMIHSSSAVTGIAMAFVAKSNLSLEAAIAIVLGANVGTCFTAWLASLGANMEAKLASYAHIALNVAGVLVFLPFIGMLSNVAAKLADSPDVQLAHVSVIFNVLCSLAALPFTEQIANFFYHFFPDRRSV